MGDGISALALYVELIKSDGGGPSDGGEKEKWDKGFAIMLILHYIDWLQIQNNTTI